MAKCTELSLIDDCVKFDADFIATLNGVIERVNQFCTEYSFLRPEVDTKQSDSLETTLNDQTQELSGVFSLDASEGAGYRYAVVRFNLFSRVDEMQNNTGANIIDQSIQTLAISEVDSISSVANWDVVGLNNGESQSDGADFDNNGNIIISPISSDLVDVYYSLRTSATIDGVDEANIGINATASCEAEIIGYIR